MCRDHVAGHCCKDKHDYTRSWSGVRAYEGNEFGSSGRNSKTIVPIDLILLHIK